MQRNFSVGEIPYRSPKTHLYSLLEIINENEVLCQNEYLVIITAMIIIVFSDSLKQGKFTKDSGTGESNALPKIFHVNNHKIPFIIFFTHTKHGILWAFLDRHTFLKSKNGNPREILQLQLNILHSSRAACISNPTQNGSGFI